MCLYNVQKQKCKIRRTAFHIDTKLNFIGFIFDSDTSISIVKISNVVSWHGFQSFIEQKRMRIIASDKLKYSRDMSIINS